MERTGVTTQRLFAAADRLLEAMASEHGMHALVRMSAAAADGGTRDGVFTEPELVEAMILLRRLGLAGTPGGREMMGDA